MFMRLKQLPEIFCWSKMGTEAGESLDDILRRKEIERIANDGVFTWGIGNSLGGSMAQLIQNVRAPMVVFTKMKSKPKVIDETPESLLLWLTYIDANGNECPLPRYSLVTSRGHTDRATKKRSHYALLCSHRSPLKQMNNTVLDSLELRNLITGKPVGYSQVTSVVKRVEKIINDEKIYNIGFKAYLKNEGQVKLSKAVEISETDLGPLLSAAESGSVKKWKIELNKLKKGLCSEDNISSYQKPQLSMAF